MTQSASNHYLTREVVELPTWLRPLSDLVAPGTVQLIAPAALGNPAPQRKDAAVLFAFSGESMETGRLLLQQRALGLRYHPGQVSLPGGRFESCDADLVATALREAREEVSLDPAHAQVLGVGVAMPTVVSGFNVTPVFAYLPTFDGVYAADPGEVAKVVEVPVTELLDPGRRGVTSNARGFMGPAFDTSGLFIWGFTAMMLDGLWRQVGWHRDFDEQRLLSMPDAVKHDGPGV